MEYVSETTAKFVTDKGTEWIVHIPNNNEVYFYCPDLDIENQNMLDEIILEYGNKYATLREISGEVAEFLCIANFEGDRAFNQQAAHNATLKGSL